jgi:hypothetical protein
MIKTNKSKEKTKLRLKYMAVFLMLAAVVACAVFLPHLIFTVYDNYRFLQSNVADSRITDISQLGSAYQQDGHKRLAAFASGIENGKKYVTVEVELDDEEIDDIAENVLKEPDVMFSSYNEYYEHYEKYIYDADTMVNTTDKTSISQTVFSEESLHIMNFLLPIEDTAWYDMYIEQAVDAVQRDTCRKYVVYDEGMEDGVALSMIYMEVSREAEDFKLVLLADTYDYTIYYMELWYPEAFLDYYGWTDSMNWVYQNDIESFSSWMQNYYDADVLPSPQYSELINDENSKKYFTVILPFDGINLNAYMGNFRPSDSSTYRVIGLGIQELGEMAEKLLINKQDN